MLEFIALVNANPVSYDWVYAEPVISAETNTLQMLVLFRGLKH